MSFGGKGAKQAAIIALCLALAAGALELSGLRQSLLPGDERIKLELGELKKAQAQLQKEFEQSAELKARRERFAANAKDCWVPQRDGKPETEIPKAINQAAKLTGMKVASLGDLRQIKVSDGISVLEVSLAATDSLETITRFMAEIYRANPKMKWQRCQIRPDGAKDSRKVSLSGSLSFLCVSDERLAALLGVGGGKG